MGERSTAESDMKPVTLQHRVTRTRDGLVGSREACGKLRGLLGLRCAGRSSRGTAGGGRTGVLRERTLRSMVRAIGKYGPPPSNSDPSVSSTGREWRAPPHGSWPCRAGLAFMPKRVTLDQSVAPSTSAVTSRSPAVQSADCGAPGRRWDRSGASRARGSTGSRARTRADRGPVRARRPAGRSERVGAAGRRR